MRHTSIRTAVSLMACLALLFSPLTVLANGHTSLQPAVDGVWTQYTNGNMIRDLAFAGDTL